MPGDMINTYLAYHVLFETTMESRTSSVNLRFVGDADSSRMIAELGSNHGVGSAATMKKCSLGVGLVSQGWLNRTYDAWFATGQISNSTVLRYVM